MALVVQRPAQHGPSGPGREVRTLLARARAPRLRRRGDRVRRARPEWAGAAHRPGGQPLPLRPARVHRGPGPHADRGARRQRRAHDAAAAAARGHLRGHGLDARSRTSTGCSRRCSRSSTRTATSGRGDGRAARQQRAPPDRGPPSAGRRPRRPTSGPRWAGAVQGVARLRRARDRRVRRRLHPRPRGAHPDAAHAPLRRPARHGARAAPLRREARARRPAADRRVGRDARRRALDVDQPRGRFVFDRIVPGSTNGGAHARRRDGGGRRRAPAGRRARDRRQGARGRKTGPKGQTDLPP